MAIAMGIGIPGLIFTVAEKIVPVTELSPQQTTIMTIPTETVIEDATDPNIVIPVLMTDGAVLNMNLETYLVGVLLGEMPMDFHSEAIKAQAVVARTYALKRMMSGNKHPSGGVCVDASCCQAYCDAGSYIAGGGTQDSVDKAIAAVAETEGQVLLYNGKLIEATYFSCSGGRTEDAVAVWGNDIPYLQAVDSPGEENATYYTETVKFSSKEFAERLGISQKGLPATWLGAVTYTTGGGVDTMMIGGISFRGTLLRQKLDLRSTAFSVTAIGDTVYITTKGFGHRVGMSQYGADAMALRGDDFQNILAHYYPGTSLNLYSQN